MHLRPRRMGGGDSLPHCLRETVMYRHPMPRSAHEREARERAPKPELTVTPLPTPSSQATLAEIADLARLPDTLTASIYVPCHRAGPDRQQDRILAKNLVHEAQRQAQATSRPQQLVDVLDASLQAIGEPGFWTHPAEGLALFVTAAGWKHLWVPAPVPALAVVAERPHLKPIADFSQESERYYLLELTQHGVYLHAGSRVGLRAIPLPEVPANVDEANAAHLSEPYLEVRTTHGAGQGPAQIFGSIGDKHDKERIVHYFQQVDARVNAFLHAERVPLVLAGVDYLIPLYHQVNHYQHLLPASISGNPDLSPTTTLHQRSWAIVAAHQQQVLQELGNRFSSLESQGKASRDLSVILPAAFQGRISDLFVARDVDHWGTYLPSADRLHQHSPRRPEDEDLLNLALVQALRTRARVHVSPHEQVPGKSDIVAYFRF